MLSLTTGASAPRSATIANAPSNTKAKPVARALRNNLADARAELAAALLQGKDVSALRDEAANQQAALDAIASARPSKAISPFVSAGQIAIGVSAQSLALSA